MNYSTILFDLDGTLTDPKQGITQSVQYALSKYGIMEENLDRLECFIGPPLEHSFMKEYGFSVSEASRAIRYYRDYFKDKGMYENRPYDGIQELLDRLIRKKRVLIVATSKPTFFAEKILRHFRLDHYFEAIQGSNMDGTLSDKTQLIRHILDQKHLSRQGTVMIGDRKHDIIGAHHNGIASIGVGYGYGSYEELTGAGPTHYVRTVQALIEAFSQ